MGNTALTACLAHNVRMHAAMKRTKWIAVASVFIAAQGCKRPSQDVANRSASAPVVVDSKPQDIGVKFNKVNPTVGAKSEETDKSDMHMKIAMGKRAFEFAEQESTKRVEEVLEVSNDAVTKLRVTFAEDSKTKAEDGKAGKTKASAVTGKTYVVFLKDGKVKVLNDKDKPASSNEATLVAKKYKSFGKPDTLFASLPVRSLKEGEEVPELANAITEKLDPKNKSEKVTFEDTKINFSGKDGEDGVFDVSVTMKVGGFMKMSIPLKGKLRAHLANARPSSLVLEGPMNFELKERDKKQGVEANGTVSVESSCSSI